MPSDQATADASWVPGDFEHPNEELRQSVKISLVFAFTLPTIAVILRIWARKLTGSKLYLDDYLILVALLFKYGCSIGVSILLFNGLGSHMDMIPTKNLEVYLKVGWSNSFVYTGTVAFVKLSILALYKRLFAVKHILLAVNVMASFVILWAVAIFVAGTLNCVPVNRFWDSSVDGYCIDAATFYYGMQIPNIFSDLVILLMPIKVVIGLPVSKYQKLLLSGVFLVGGLTLIFDIVRLWVMIGLTRSGADITYNQAPVAMWTCLEGAVGIVGACLPNLRPLFRFGQSGFWSQLRSSSGRSGKTLLNSTTTSSTTVTSGRFNTRKPVLMSEVTEEGTEGIEIHQYSKYIDGGQQAC